MRRASLIFIIASLFAVGFGIFFYKANVLGFPLVPNTTNTSWHIEAKLDYVGTGKPVNATLYVPQNNSTNHILIDEQFISDNYGLNLKQYTNTGNRAAQWTKRSIRGRDTLYYRSVIYQLDEGHDETKTARPKQSVPRYGTSRFAKLADENPHFMALHTLIQELYDKSANTESLINSLFTMLRQQNDGRISVISQSIEGPNTIANTAQYILNHAGTPARLVNGLVLDQTRNHASFDHWVEVYLDNYWHALDMTNGSVDTDTKRLIWWYGSKPVFEIEGARNQALSVSIRQHTESAVTESLWRGNPHTKLAYEWSPFYLPIGSQLVFEVLLLIPLGALVGAFMRQIIGIRSFGTFMPILIAIAFRETQLILGIALFSAILAAGLIVRAWLDKLQLLLVPRLTAILTIVVLIMLGMSLLTFKMGLPAGLSISLFPMVILAMVIERMSMTWEEYGARTALLDAFGSLVVAVAAYAVMTYPLATHIMFTFPELLLVVIALCLMLGRYHGYKLIEYWRFRSLMNSQDKDA